MPVARNHPRRHGQKQIQAAVDVNQRHHLVTTAPLIALVCHIHFFGIDRVVVVVEQQLHRVFIVFVVGNKNVTGVTQKQPFGIEQLQGPQATRHFPVEPGMQPIGPGVAGEFAQEILIAGSLPAMGVLVVESLAGQRDIGRVRMHRLAPYIGAERGDQAAGAQHIGEGVIGGIVEFEADLAAEIEPDGHFFFFPWSRIGFRQTGQNVAGDQMAEQVRFGGFRNVLHVIDFAAAQSFEHELAVVFEGDKIHRLSSFLPVAG